jgi:hypothetical protein
MTHLTHKSPKLTLKISNPSNFYPKLRSVNPKLWVFEPHRLGLEAQAWGLVFEETVTDIVSISPALRVKPLGSEKR